MLGYHTPPPPPSRHPPGNRHTPPGADTPPEQTPPLEQTPLGADTPQSRPPPPPGADTHPHPKEQTPSPLSPPPPRGADTPPPGAGTHRKQTHPGSRLRHHTVNERPVRILLECILVRTIFGDDDRSSSPGTSVKLFWGLQHHQFSLNFRYQLLAAQGNLLFTRRRKLVLRTNHYPPTYMFILTHTPWRKYSGKGSFTLVKCERESEFFFDLCHCSLSTLNWDLSVTFAFACAPI